VLPAGYGCKKIMRLNIAILVVDKIGFNLPRSRDNSEDFLLIWKFIAATLASGPRGYSFPSVESR
jgi:hypothetical protein